MPSSILYHGPGAREAAILEAHNLGRLLIPPVGDDGLKTEDARMVVELLLSTPVGVKLGTVVIGPMDESVIKAADVLLKTLEEYEGDLVQPILWADDLGSVSPTIRSRCLARWAPPGTETDENESLVSTAWGLVDASVAGNRPVIIELMRSDTERGKALLNALADCLATKLDDPKHLALWKRLRPVTQTLNPSDLEIIVALMGV